jgi:(1->4)-alpha-D-glucan 1-alpha-D-glucosylmutase
LLQTLPPRATLLGALNSLSELTLKATLPGAPDFYQGTEFWDFSMVDPDNRRPVDFTARARALEALQAPDWQQLTKDWPNGYVKLAWTRHLLKLRTELADVFANRDYAPLQVHGPHRDHFIAYARRQGRNAAIVVIPRCFASFTDKGPTRPIAASFDATADSGGYAVGGFADTDASGLRLSDLLKIFPVAVVKAGYHGKAKPVPPAPA